MNDEGDISKPVVSENSALYQRARFILNERALLTKQPKVQLESVITEILRPDENPSIFRRRKNKSQINSYSSNQPQGFQ